VTGLSEELPDAVTDFLRLSVVLTGFEDYELFGTGLLETYYDELLQIIGSREAGALFGAVDRVEPGNEHQFRVEILDNERYGPVARSILMMWYLGAWTQLPRKWRNRHGATSFDTDHVVSAAAYREGLVWPAAGTHPMGAKQPGFGSWARPSSLPEEP
jgi:hypothetical protein